MKRKLIKRNKTKLTLELIDKHKTSVFWWEELRGAYSSIPSRVEKNLTYTKAYDKAIYAPWGNGHVQVPIYASSTVKRSRLKNVLDAWIVLTVEEFYHVSNKKYEIKKGDV